MNDNAVNLDDTIGFGLQQFLGIFDWVYIFSLIFIVAILFKYVLAKLPTAGPLSILQVVNKIDRIWVVIMVGALWGWATMKMRGTGLTEQLVVSFPFAVLVHKALLSRLLQFLKLEDNE